MSVAPARRPLIYATTAALQQAARLLPPGAVLERLVEEAILAGDVAAGADGGIVFLEQQRLVAQVVRKAGRTRPKPRSWFVIDVRRDVRRRRMSAPTKTGAASFGQAAPTQSEGGRAWP